MLIEIIHPSIHPGFNKEHISLSLYLYFTLPAEAAEINKENLYIYLYFTQWRQQRERGRKGDAESLHPSIHPSGNQ